VWGSWLVDIRDKDWQSLLLETVIPNIFAKGFHGLFLDTVDKAAYLEEKDPKNLQLSDKVVEDLASVATKKQLKDMALAKVEGAAPKVEIVIKQMLDNYDVEKNKKQPDATVLGDYESRLAECGADSHIGECLSQAVRDRLGDVQVSSAGGGLRTGDEVQWTNKDGVAMTGEVKSQGEVKGTVVVVTEGNPGGFAMNTSNLNKVPLGEPVSAGDINVEVKWKTAEGKTVRGTISDSDEAMPAGQAFVKTKANPRGFAVNVNKLRTATAAVDPDKQAKVDAAAGEKTNLGG